MKFISVKGYRSGISPGGVDRYRDINSIKDLESIDLSNGLIGKVWNNGDVDRTLVVSTPLWKELYDYDYVIVETDFKEKGYFITSFTQNVNEQITLGITEDVFGTNFQKTELEGGTVIQRPRYDGDEIPYTDIQPYKYGKIKSRTLLDSWGNIVGRQGYPNNLLWVIISTTYTGDGNTGSRLLFFPFEHNRSRSLKYTHAGTTYSVPSQFDVTLGQFDEALGLTTENIRHAWITDTPPVDFAINDNVITSISASVYIHGSNCCFLSDVGISSPTCKELNNYSYDSCGMTRMKITDHIGNDLFTIPNDLVHKDGTLSLYRRLSVSNNSCFVEYALTSKGDGVEWVDIKTSAVSKGTFFAYPCDEVDVSSNSYSDYMYSGLRALDIQGKKLQAQQSLDSSILSAKYSMTQGVAQAGSSSMFGAMMGSVVPGIGTLVGAGLGFASSLSSTAIGGVAAKKQAKAQMKLTIRYNALEQGITDNQMRSQLPSVITTGDGLSWLTKCDGKPFFRLIREELQTNVDLVSMHNRFGYTVNEYYDDANVFKSVTGYVKFSDLIVKGTLPGYERDYIRDCLIQGVRLVG